MKPWRTTTNRFQTRGKMRHNNDMNRRLIVTPSAEEPFATFRRIGLYCLIGFLLSIGLAISLNNWASLALVALSGCFLAVAAGIAFFIRRNEK